MAKNTKTPVMVLQELTVKRGYNPPEYNLVYSVQGTHENEFHYQVIVHTVSAKGQGRSKKEAKHDAAELALQLLAEKGVYRPDQSADDNKMNDVRTEGSCGPMKPPLNCIPKLMDMCGENKIPTPRFVEISAVGPPHCREFTYECHVASITTRAIAGSKKHAKQLAAKSMLDKIINVLPEIQEQCESNQLKLTEMDKDAVDKFIELSKLSEVKINFNADISKYDLHFKNLLKEKYLDREKVMQYFSLPKEEETLSQLLHSFELKHQINIIQEEPPIVTLNINTDIPMCVIEGGSNLPEAYENAFNKMFLILSTFLQ